MTTVTRAGARVTKTLSVEAATDPRVELAIDSDHEYPIAVRIRESLPDGLEPSAIEFSGEDDGDSWWVFGGGLEFSRIVKPGETTRTAYVAHTLDAANGAGLVAPTIEVVSPVDPEDAENGDVPLWRGHNTRTMSSVAGNDKNDSSVRTNGAGAATQSNVTATPADPAARDVTATAGVATDETKRERIGGTDAETESSPFEFPTPDVGALSSALRHRLRALAGPWTLRRSVRGASLSDDVFDVLSNARRRRVLIHLFETDEPATLRDLPRSVAAWENGVSEDDVTSQQRKRVYTALRQNHLPKMDRAGVVDYDANRGSVELTGEATRLRPYLDVTIRRWNWERYYLLLGVLWCGIVAATWSGVVTLGPRLGFALAGLAGLSIVCSALVPITHRWIGAE